MTDTHAHIDLCEDPEGALERDASLTAILTLGTDVEHSQASLELGTSHANVFAGVGLHPTEAEKYSPDVAARLRELASHPRVRASGETGIDYYWDAASREAQLRVLDFQVELAEARDLVMVFHVRSKQGSDAAERELEGWLRANEPSRFVLHAFGGDMALAETALELGGYVSFAGNLTYKKNEHLRQAAALMPLERLLVETDSPFMPPVPKRGKKNEPSFVRYTLEVLARVRGLEFAAMEKITDENAARLFKW
ncbi:TatD family hydrolase [Oceanithermus sp.]